ncbi:transcriptional regulator [Corallococcus sp. CA053C]|uniref:YciI family protein n=1 Tax=Corallococcus sp. CA053C TaxID=2316732 RepID=UPI000EA40433|nr:YciI family protein [Corallococcus sp. CA053C]RKH13605.1 transcriptional regulator [Corallococcus sp. CA053C]
MRFLSLVRVQESPENRPSERLMTEMEKLLHQMGDEGVLLDTAGLFPTSQAVRLRNNRGKHSRTDGPFTETKEMVGGYALFKADSMDEALALTKRFLAVHGEEWNVECEVRQVVDM